MRYIAVLTIIIGVLGGFIALARLTAPPPESDTQVSTMTPTLDTAPTPTYPPGREPIVLPMNFRESLVHYATVDRVDAMSRNLYISPEAVDAVLAGEPIPENTLIVIEAYQAATDGDGTPLRDNERLVQGDIDPEIHVGERRSTWLIEDLAASSHLGGWNFAAFDSTTLRRNVSTLNDCFSCHDAASQREFIFTRSLIRAYGTTGEVQYRFCGRPGRQICG